MTKHLQIRFEDDEHDRFSEWAKKAGYSSLQRAGKAACLRAIGSVPDAAEVLSNPERRFVDTALEFYRDTATEEKNDEDLRGAVLMMMRLAKGRDKK